ncbi:MAG: hypothetical protein QRY74_04465 [Chlamydia sp.]
MSTSILQTLLESDLDSSSDTAGGKVFCPGSCIEDSFDEPLLARDDIHWIEGSLSISF